MFHGDLNRLIPTKPFRPFRITMVDGATYDVRFREAFVLTPTFLMVGLLPSTDGENYERGVILDLMSITTLEPLPVPVSPQGNGQSAG